MYFSAFRWKSFSFSSSVRSSVFTNFIMSARHTSENDTVDAESLLGTLKADFRHNAAGRHHHILVLEVVSNRVLHLHLVVPDPCKAVVHPVDDEREEFAQMAENHSQLGELVEGAVVPFRISRNDVFMASSPKPRPGEEYT